jgi:hypothetical protein
MKAEETMDPLRLIFLLLFIMIPATVSAQKTKAGTLDGEHWSLSLEWLHYRSYSQQNNKIPMKAGYPVILSQTPVLGLGYRVYGSKARHTLDLNFGIPATLDSDNGGGQNLLLRDRMMSYYRIGLDYHLHWHLLRWKKFSLDHGLTSGLLYEKRNLHYLAGSREKTQDMNFYLGPALHLQYDLGNPWTIGGTFDARFYLPYFNYGTLDAIDEEGMLSFTSEYHGFYYQTLFTLALTRGLDNGSFLQLGVTKNDLVGFAGREPSFRVNEVVHFKLDRLFHFYIRYTL